MAWLLAIALLFLTACAPQSVLGESQHLGAGALDTAPASSVRLPAGEYYVLFRQDRNELWYYALSEPTARFLGKAVVDTKACFTSTSGAYVVFDRQRQVDIFPPCQQGAGFIQMPAGLLGRVRALRTIVTPFPRTAVLVGDVDSDGDVAVGYAFDAAGNQSSSHILFYGPLASGSAEPSYSLPVFTRNCNDPGIAKGPGRVPGSPAQIDFDDSNQLVTLVGPTGLAACGVNYVERFAVGAKALTSWLVPGRIISDAPDKDISFTPSGYALARDGTITFGAYVGAINAGRDGGVTYAKSAAGFRPRPSYVFTDATNALGGQRAAGTVVTGIDRYGNVLLQGQVGGSVIVEFPPHRDGNVKPLRTIRLPQEALGWPGTFVEIR